MSSDGSCTEIREDVTFELVSVNPAARWVPEALSGRPFVGAWPCELCTKDITMAPPTQVIVRIVVPSEGWNASKCKSCNLTYHAPCLEAYRATGSSGGSKGCPSCGNEMSTFPIFYPGP